MLGWRGPGGLIVVQLLVIGFLAPASQLGHLTLGLVILSLGLLGLRTAQQRAGTSDPLHAMAVRWPRTSTRHRLSDQVPAGRPISGTRRPVARLASRGVVSGKPWRPWVGRLELWPTS
jgi:hypothetical protein